MSINNGEVADFFHRYELVFSDAMEGHVDLKAVKQLYAEQFIAATPQGVRAAAFDRSFEAVMSKGYERYRSLGTKSMKVEGIETYEIDDCHLMARVRWHSVYQKPGSDEIHIPFDVNYLLEKRNDDLKVFGWITGDEEELLKARGVL